MAEEPERAEEAARRLRERRRNAWARFAIVSLVAALVLAALVAAFVPAGAGGAAVAVPVAIGLGTFAAVEIALFFVVVRPVAREAEHAR